MVDHPAAKALTGYLLVRGGVHQVAYARALENLTGADLTNMFPTPNIPTYRGRLQRHAPGDRRGARGRRRAAGMPKEPSGEVNVPG